MKIIIIINRIWNYMLYKLLKKNNKKEYPQIFLKDKNKNGAKAQVTRTEIRNQTQLTIKDIQYSHQLLFGVTFFPY